MKFLSIQISLYGATFLKHSVIQIRKLTVLSTLIVFYRIKEIFDDLHSGK